MVTECVCKDRRIFLGWPGWGSQWSRFTIEQEPRWELSSLELGNKVVVWQQLEKCETTPGMVCLYQVLFYKTGTGAVRTEKINRYERRPQVFQQGREVKKTNTAFVAKRGGSQKGQSKAWDAEEWQKAGCWVCENGTKSWRKRRQGFHNVSAHSLPIEIN